MTGIDDLYVTNNKGQHAVHVSSTREVLQCLYENGADLWVLDGRGRYPLFMCSLQGYVDCVSFLLEIATTTGGKWTYIESGDNNGDTALHAACLTGQIQVVTLLLFFLRNNENKKGMYQYSLLLSLLLLLHHSHYSHYHHHHHHHRSYTNDVSRTSRTSNYL